MTSLKANELQSVKAKPVSCSALCGYQSSRRSAALWPNMENDAVFLGWYGTVGTGHPGTKDVRSVGSIFLLWEVY